MNFIGLSLHHLLRDPDAKPNIDHMHPAAGDETEAEPSDAEEYYLCVQCKGVIAHRVDEIRVDGAYSHAFANPLGIVFEIGCFKYALGCTVVGPASDDFTWFQGYRWKVTYCKYCLSHLGWHFMSSGGDDFYGLIIDRLMLSNPKAG